MDKATFEVRLANWTNIVKQCQARPSGQTISQWCREAGIGEKKYYYWQRKVRRQAVEQMENMLPVVPAASDNVAFAEVKIPPVSSSDHTSADDTVHTIQFQPDVLIRRGDLVIGVTNKASDRTVNAVNNIRYKLTYSNGDDIDADNDGKADITEVKNGEIRLHRVLKPGSDTEYEWPKVTVLELEKYEADGSELVQYQYYFIEDEVNGWTSTYFNTSGNKWDAVATSAMVAAEGKFKIQNTKYTVELPSTGGSGTSQIHLIGALFTALAGAALVMKKKRKTT